MFKNIIIVVLVLSNIAFLIFAMYQKQMASKWAVAVQTVDMDRSAIISKLVRTQTDLALTRQTTDSLRNELAKIQE